jgi:hypothetical protein
MGVILILSDPCTRNPHTAKLMKVWPLICDTIKKEYPNMKFIQYLDYNKEFAIYDRWFPRIIYLPDIIWDQVSSNEIVDLRQHTFVFNGFFDDTKSHLQWKGKYDYIKPHDYIRWINDVAIFEDDEFLIKNAID